MQTVRRITHALAWDKVIQVIGDLVGRNRTGIRTKPKRPKRTLSAAAQEDFARAEGVVGKNKTSGSVSTELSFARPI